MEVQIPTREGGNFEGEKGPAQDMPGHVRRSICQSNSAEGRTGTVHADAD